MRVLVVDDDPISRSVLLDVIGTFPQLEVDEADSGEAAWQLLSDGLHPVFVCVDVNMGEMSGLDLLRKIRGEPRMAKIPVLMVTAVSDSVTVTEALKMGASDFIIKPFQAADVRSKIDATLSKAAETMFEDAGAASRRMGIAPLRYTAYLDSLAWQIDSALLKVEAGTPLDKHALRVLHTGCLTLGATYCAMVIDLAAKKLTNAPPLSAGVTAGIGGLSVILRVRSAAMRKKWG